MHAAGRKSCRCGHQRCAGHRELHPDAARGSAGVSAAVGQKAGVSNPYLSQIERGLRKPSADVLNQIAKALRVSAEVLYVRAGILEPSETSEVRDAIITDSAITERQKQVLLDIYTSFCQQNEAAGEEPTTDQAQINSSREIHRKNTGKELEHGQEDPEEPADR